MTLGEQAEREAFERALRATFGDDLDVADEFAISPVTRDDLEATFQAGVRYGLELRGCCERPGATIARAILAAAVALAFGSGLLIGLEIADRLGLLK